MLSRCVCISAVAAICASAQAQNFRLDLFLVAREVTGTSGNFTLADVGGPQNTRDTARPQTINGNLVNAVVGREYRVELRYRIADLTADTVGSRGLTSAQINFSVNPGVIAPTNLHRADLTPDQANGSVSRAADPEAFAGFLPDPTTGLIGLFRGGLTSDAAASNGAPSLSGWTVLPVSLAAPGQRSYAQDTVTANPTAANTDANGDLWGLYTFAFTYNGGRVTFNATTEIDPVTGNRFGLFTRSGTTNNPAPITSTLANDGVITFVPAPGAATLMAIAGVLNLRRRRQHA